MKKNFLLTFIILLGILSNQANAQIRVNVDINVGVQPAWGPSGYYHADYYYLPDIDVYYNVPQRQFVYLDGGKWVFAASLPPRCGSYDLYRGYKVVMNEPNPYLRHEAHYVKYAKYKNCYGYQRPIHDNQHDRDDDDHDGPGNHGRGHAYGHDKHHGHDD
ncbi:MAG TPA: hypothetical protein VFV08_11940 [Puia sp.]|nr:hypothetical protein [Puia sp.]